MYDVLFNICSDYKAEGLQFDLLSVFIVSSLLCEFCIILHLCFCLDVGLTLLTDQSSKEIDLLLKILLQSEFLKWGGLKMITEGLQL